MGAEEVFHQGTANNVSLRLNIARIKRLPCHKWLFERLGNLDAPFQQVREP